MHPLITNATDKAEQQLFELKQQATEKMKISMAAEIERLTALKKINPNIRDEEINFFTNQASDLEKYIDKSQLKLDAIRLIVVTH